MMKGRVKDSALSTGGNVTVKKIRRNAVVKTSKYNNHATSNLLYGIARFIRGDFRDFPTASDNFLPKFLGVGIGEPADPSASDTSLINELQITRRFDVVPGRVEQYQSDGVIKLILTSFITSNVVGGRELTEIGLFTSATPGQGNMLAKVNITDESGNGQTLGSGESLQVDWEITLGNNSDLSE